MFTVLASPGIDGPEEGTRRTRGTSNRNGVAGGATGDGHGLGVEEGREGE